MDIRPYFILPLACCFMLEPVATRAQQPATMERTEQHTPAITVIPDQIQFNGVDFPAHTVIVHGTNSNKAFQLWRNDVRAQSRDIKGRRPTIARGVVIPSLDALPVTILASTKGDRSADLARLTLAFAQNDSTPLADNGTQQQYMYELAVKYNQKVLQEQISAKEKELAKARKRSDKAASAQQRVQNKLQRAQDKLEQVRLRRERAQGDKAEIEGQVIGLQRKMEYSDKPRDQKRLLRARRELSKRDGQVLKYMEQEAALQADINKYSGQLPDQERTQREKNTEVERIEKEIDQLQVTRDSIE